MTATVTLSMEIELAWGKHDKKDYAMLSNDRGPETETLTTLLTYCDQLFIPFTFDIVGHLLHDSCSGSHPSPHSNSWFDEDPGSGTTSHPHFYAPDLVSKITDTGVEHEIATHTYSHTLFDEVSRETIEWELDQVLERHKKANLPKPKSLVSPRHRNVSFDILKEYGIETVRVPFSDYRRPDTSGKVESLYWFLTRRHPVGEISCKDGITLTPGSHHPSLTTQLLPVGQQSINPLLRYVLPVLVRQRIHHRYLVTAIERAIEEDAHLHLWTHLYNMSNKQQLRPIQSSLKYLSQKVAAGEIQVRTMEELPDTISEG